MVLQFIVIQLVTDLVNRRVHLEVIYKKSDFIHNMYKQNVRRFSKLFENFNS